MSSKKNRWSSAILQPQRVQTGLGPQAELVGRLPVNCVIAILQHATLPDTRSLALCSRKAYKLARDNRVWAYKLALLDYKGSTDHHAQHQHRSSRSDVEDIQRRHSVRKSVVHSSSTSVSPTKKTDELDEDAFGDFVDVKPSKDANDLLLDFDGGEDIGMNTASPQKNKRSQTANAMSGGKGRHKAQNTSVDISSQNSAGVSLLDAFRAIYSSLLPYYISMQTHTASSLVFTQPNLNPLERARILSALAKLMLQALCPTRSVATLTVFRRNLLSSIDYFEGSLLSEFERADTQNDEQAMKRCASVAWALQANPAASKHSTPSTGNNIFQVFLNKREIFYDQSHNPMKNLVKLPSPDGSRKGDLVDGIDFSAMDKYMTHVLDVIASDGGLIARVFPVEADLLLEFAERLAQDAVSEYVTPLLSSAQNLPNPLFLLATAASFAQSMRLVDAILAIKPKSVRVNKTRTEDVIYRMFEVYMDDYLSEEGEWIKQVLEGICKAWNQKILSDPEVGTSLFLTSTNAAQAKRNVMSSFGKALLLPVTVVPKTVVYSLNAVTTGAFNAVVQIGAGIGGLAGTTTNKGNVISTIAGDEEALQDLAEEAQDWQARQSLDTPATTTSPQSNIKNFAKLQLLLSLDVALQLIQADRECLKRIQTFAGYPGIFGRKVRDAIEEAFIILLQTMAVLHVLPAFKHAEQHMNAYKPSEHEADRNVGPLTQFFELVHIGDTISQMIQVFYDAELARYIDRTDFLNVVVREKKKFESSIDDCVASGLNIGVALLMGQVEHLMLTKQEATDFCPAENANMDLRPTPACSAVIECLQIHCNMLKGCTDKQILEVFYVEIGIRLHSLILKHLKRSMISPNGGLQVISDINAYHAFIQSLRQATIMPYFSALKMVSNVFIIDSPKDMATMVKDVQRYEGTLRSEDAYELLQRRTDWRLKEKAVDKALYGLSTEDCLVC